MPSENSRDSADRPDPSGEASPQRSIPQTDQDTVRATSVACPFCECRVLIEEKPSQEVVCPECGRRFHVAGVSLPPRTPAALPPEIDHYQILELVGSGGFGSVYKAFDRDLQRPVALKVPHPSAFRSPEEQERFLQEARQAAQLNHPHIVHVYELVRYGELPAMVIEYVQGQTLSTWRQSERPGIYAIAELMMKLAGALDYAHNHQVIHRDMKPGNILVDGRGEPRVTDFGLAGPEHPRASVTFGGHVYGTPGYISPEQVTGEASGADRRSDIYSLGVIFYELLTGQLPYPGESRAVFQALLKGEPKPPRQINPRIPRDIEGICLRAMARDPEKRYPTAADFRQDIQRYFDGQPVAARVIGVSERGWRWCRRNRLATGLLALFIALVAASFVMAVRTREWLNELSDQERIARLNEQYARRSLDAAREKIASSEKNVEERAAEATEYRKKVEQQSREITEREEVARRHIYAAQINLAQQAMDRGDPSRAMQILMGLRPQPGQPDDRRFEWDYLRSLCSTESRAVLPGHARPVAGVAIAPNGHALASFATGDKAVRLWDLTTMQERQALQDQNAVVSAIAFNPAGTLLAAGCRDGGIRLWDVPGGKLVTTLVGHTGQVQAVAFSPDGERLASGGSSGTFRTWEKYGELRVWQVKLAQPAATLDGNFGMVEGVSFSPDGTKLASGGWDKKVRIWDIARREAIQTVASHFDTVSSVLFLPEGDRVVSSSFDGTIKVWRVADGREMASLRGHTSRVVQVVGTRDGRWIASAGWDGTVKVWNVAEGRPAASFTGHEGRALSVTISADGAVVASGGDDRTVRLWRLQTAPADRVLRGHTDRMTGLAFSPDAARLASGGLDRTIRIWDVRTGQMTASSGETDFTPIAFAFPREGNFLAIGGGSPETRGKVELRELDLARPFKTLEGTFRGVLAIALRDDGKAVHVASYDGTVRTWETEGEARVAFEVDPAVCRTAAFLLPKSRFAAGGASAVTVRELPTGREVAVFRFEGEMTCLGFSPDGTLLAGAIERKGRSDTEVRVWNIETMEPRAVLKGHNGSVYSLTFSPDGQRVVTGGADRTVRIWDPLAGQELAVVRGHTSDVRCVAMALDGKAVAGGGQDGTIRLWQAGER